MENGHIPPEIWQRFDELIERNQSFVVTTHVNPDGDGAGSELALYEFLRQRGKDVSIINNNDVPRIYSFLTQKKEIFKTYTPDENTRIARSDVIIVLDISTLERLGGMERCVRDSPAIKICIDHHSGNCLFADLNIISESACATAELIFELYQVLGGILTKSAAEALYVAILTDTEFFSNLQTTTQSHVIAAELLRIGVKPAEICQQINQNYSWERFSLFRAALSTLSRDSNGKLAWLTIDKQMVAESGALREEIDGFVDFPLSLRDVELSILFLEVPNRGTKISIRSRNRIEAHKFAHEFGGGGHKHAAGIRLLDVPLKDALPAVLGKARRLFDEIPADSKI